MKHGHSQYSATGFGFVCDYVRLIPNKRNGSHLAGNFKLLFDAEECIKRKSFSSASDGDHGWEKQENLHPKGLQSGHGRKIRHRLPQRTHRKGKANNVPNCVFTFTQGCSVEFMDGCY